jgi:type IV secretion system protein VirB9
VGLGVPTQVELPAGETLERPPHAGMGSDCEKPEQPWCLYWSPGDSYFVVKPKSGATAQLPNNVFIKTAQRSYTFVFQLGAAKHAVHRLRVQPPGPAALSPAEALAMGRMNAAMSVMPQPGEVMEQRLQACPKVVNSDYTVAEGKGSQDIVPAAVFDDGRFTYLSYPDNRPVPAAVQIEADGNKRALNLTTDCGFVTLDRVVREFWLRHGGMVVSIKNNAFNLDGRGPVAGTAADGVQRLVRDPKTGAFKEQRQ